MSLQPIGAWQPTTTAPAFSSQALCSVVSQLRQPAHVVREDSGRVGVGLGGQLAPPDTAAYPLLASLPALYPEWLGDRAFLEAHGLRFPYCAGAMANGIATAEMVIAMGKAGMLGFFGAAGLTPPTVEAALDSLQAALGDEIAWGSNLIHSPQEPEIEARVAELYIRRGVKRVSASAYMALTAPIVRYAASGLRTDPAGKVLRAHHVFAKISRPEVAEKFLAPAPSEILQALVAAGQLTESEARIAATVPVAEDLIVESDSGGHTDNRPLPALFPSIQFVRDAAIARYGYTRPIRLGAAGGLGTPAAVAGAFALGASFVLTGSVNQSAVESGLCAYGRGLLAKADLADVVMAPAADMFELGVKVQVLQRGTMFGVRAQKLYDLYKAYPSLDAIPSDERARLERDILKTSVDEIWAGTEAFFAQRNPAELARAQADPKHKMALVFRWYLGLSSRWAISGEAGRELDYQIWTGPAMGSFNRWVKGSFLEDPAQRTVVQIAHNLLEGAACLTRAHQLRSYGVPVPAAAFSFVPRPLTA